MSQDINKDKALAAALGQIEKQFGKGSIMRLGDGAAAMILGIGTDLANIERIERTLERFGDRFRNRVFTETERVLETRRVVLDLLLARCPETPLVRRLAAEHGLRETSVGVTRGGAPMAESEIARREAA